MASHLTFKEREVIHRLRRRGKSNAEIAELLGRHRSTIYRELNRNRGQRRAILLKDSWTVSELRTEVRRSLGRAHGRRCAAGRGLRPARLHHPKDAPSRLPLGSQALRRSLSLGLRRHQDLLRGAIPQPREACPRHAGGTAVLRQSPQSPSPLSRDINRISTGTASLSYLTS